MQTWQFHSSEDSTSQNPRACTNSNRLYRPRSPHRMAAPQQLRKVRTVWEGTAIGELTTLGGSTHRGYNKQTVVRDLNLSVHVNRHRGDAFFRGQRRCAVCWRAVRPWVGMRRLNSACAIAMTMDMRCSKILWRPSNGIANLPRRITPLLNSICAFVTSWAEASPGTS